MIRVHHRHLSVGQEMPQVLLDRRHLAGAACQYDLGDLQPFLLPVIQHGSYGNKHPVEQRHGDLDQLLVRQFHLPLELPVRNGHDRLLCFGQHALCLCRAP